jgi:molybdenum cofactor biosynthesis protein B
MSHTEHRANAPAAIRCAVLTISDTRTEATDSGGAAVVSLLAAAGHVVTGKTIVRDEPAEVRFWIEKQVASDDARILITTGGTGITARDGTFEVASAIIEKPLPGFGEIFRMLSYQEIGAAAMLSRACAGRVGRSLLVCLPGSEHAVRLAMDKLLLPELGHLVREATR